MSVKTLWLDCETTGLVPYKHGIIQLGGMIEIGGEVVETFNFRMQPCPTAIIDDKAMQVNKITPEELRTYPSSNSQYCAFINVLDKYINKFNKEDKFILAGYNVQFDDGFVNHWFKRNGNNYWYSYVNSAKLDVMSSVATWRRATNTKTPNNKLSTIAEWFGIGGNFHDALDDIKATRELELKIQEVMCGIRN